MRITGLETEYGCLVSDERSPGGADAWPVRVKGHLFRRRAVGVLDLHYRDYEEPPGNGGFLRNGGRLYLDMGHLEYSSPECLTLADLAAYDAAGDALVQSALDDLGASERVAFIKNNVDHHTGATFGCHENYLVQRAAEFSHENIAALLAFLATRQIYAGAGRVGEAHGASFDWEPARPSSAVGGPPVEYQISQRADHIVNDIYQWVQFNRAIINARDEPLADPRRFRRLHLLIGDSNPSPFACALKCGATAAVLSLLEEDAMPRGWELLDAVEATRAISRDQSRQWAVPLADGRTCDALDVQLAFLAAAQARLAGRDDETDWLLAQWEHTLACLRPRPEALLGGVDWITKRWLLEQFRAEQDLAWTDPWMQSLDLEYHNVNPERGLFFAVEPASKTIGEFNATAFAAARGIAQTQPPAGSRAVARGLAVEFFQREGGPYIINWDAIIRGPQDQLSLPDPHQEYTREAAEFLR